MRVCNRESFTSDPSSRGRLAGCRGVATARSEADWADRRAPGPRASGGRDAELPDPVRGAIQRDRAAVRLADAFEQRLLRGEQHEMDAWRWMRSTCLVRALAAQATLQRTFTKTDGMAPHNNFAERMIRPAALWRKSSCGTQSRRGSRFAECMLTLSQTLRLQGRSVLDFVERSIRAARRADAAPSLLHP